MPGYSRLQGSKTATQFSTHLLPLHTVPPHCLPIQRHLEIHVAPCGAAHSLHCMAIAAGQAAQRLHRVGQGVGARLQGSSDELCRRTPKACTSHERLSMPFPLSVAANARQLWATCSGHLTHACQAAHSLPVLLFQPLLRGAKPNSSRCRCMYAPLPDSETAGKAKNTQEAWSSTQRMLS